VSKIIVQKDGPILVDDISCPVLITEHAKKKTDLVKDLRDASLYTGVAREEIVAMADASIATAEKNGFSFSWPSLKQVKDVFQYPVSRPGRGFSQQAIAVPVEVTLTAAPKARPQKLYYRSITSCCHAWGISKETFDKISNQHLGWREALPHMMALIKTGVKAPKGYLVTESEAVDDGVLCTLRPTRKGILVDTKKLASHTFDRVQDVPAGILKISNWASARKGSAA
jgi:hypothetical protein